MQLQHIAVQLIGIFFHALDAVIAKQRLFQTVESGEFRIFRFFLEIVFAGVDAAVKVREQLSNRLNALVMLARRGVQRFRFFDVASFHRVGKGFGAADQLRGFRRHIGFISGDRFAEAQHRSRFRRVFGGGAGDDQFAFRVSEQTAGHVIFARLQVCGELLGKARRDVFALFHHHHPFQNLPLQRFLAVVLNNKLGFTRVNGDLHRLALFVVDGDFDLRDIRSLSTECRAEQRGHGHPQRITAKMNHHDHPFR
ncbi:hypothetical protein SB00610_01863 [Klebsiella quasipneumoniae subsp. similipneumoniae]|nr:hypothetical protein SB00610_01863 [Klebsiella quasipneumoniae subsp. similipneumoniae]